RNPLPRKKPCYITIVASDPASSKRNPTGLPAGKTPEIPSTTPLLKRFPRLADVCQGTDYKQHEVPVY
ncbi:MAG: hypothetical protein WD024_03220, partial [Bacillota bacterium]